MTHGLYYNGGGDWTVEGLRDFAGDRVVRRQLR